MQLDAFLKSVKKNAQYVTDVHVLYAYDMHKDYHEYNNFMHGYNKLANQYKNVNFIFEGDDPNDRQGWKKKILELVEGFKSHFMWATDDSLFYRKVELTQEKINWAFEKEAAVSLNLRMGENIVWQNHWHSEKIPEFEVKDRFEDLIVWDATNISVQNDVGRAWQNDASIMPRDLYLDRLNREEHWYQGKGCRALDNVAQSGNIFNPKFVSAFDKSVYVNVPVNLVHVLDNGRLYADNWGKFVQQDIHSLQEKFDEGKRIDWEAIDFTDLDCGRKEVEYEFG